MSEPPGAVDLERHLASLQARLRVEQRKLSAVRELSRALGATLDLDRLLATLLDKVCEILDAERATLYLLTDGGDELVSKFVQGGSVQEIHLRMGEGIAGWVAQSGATVNIPDAYSDPRFQKQFDQRTGFRTRSILCMPMPNHQGQTIGVLQVLNKRERPFDGDDEALLGAVAAHAGIAIENSKLYLSVLAKNSALLEAQEALRRRVEDLDVLVEIGRESGSAAGLDELLDRLLGRAMQLVEAEAGGVLLREQSSGELFFRAAAGGSSEIKRVKLPPGHGVAGWAALHQQPVVVNDPSHDARHDAFLADKLGFPPRSILAVPLLPSPDREGDPSLALGSIELLNRVGRRGFDDADTKLLTLIAGHASRAIEAARAKDERIKQDRLASIGQMLSGVLHDLKSPMTIVSGYAQLMSQIDDAATRERYTELILKQFDHMAAMTREVLSFARGESNLLVRKVYLHKFLAEVEEQIGRELDGKGVKLELDARYSGVAHFDELKLHRVIHNIARNAAQAMPNGGTFRVTVSADDATLRLEFADTGAGIPVELEGRLFQLFATAGKSEGTGLGLAIVKKIVDEHGGKVSYRSRSGEGTTGTAFLVELPLKQGVTSMPPPAP